MQLHHVIAWATHHPWVSFGVAVGSAVASVAACALAIVRIPADHFVRDDLPLPLAGHPTWMRLGALVTRNVLGVLLVLLGLILSVPGVPGQGLLTVLLGVMLLDLPGKRRVERAIVRRRVVHESLNRWRARFGKPAIEVPA